MLSKLRYRSEMLSKLDSRLVHHSLIVKLEILDDGVFDVICHDICELRETRPYDHVELVEVEVKHHDLILMQQSLVLVVDDTHHDNRILIMQLILDVRGHPLEVVIHYL